MLLNVSPRNKNNGFQQGGEGRYKNVVLATFSATSGRQKTTKKKIELRELAL